MSIDVENLRRDYSARELDITDVHPDPLQQFRLWFQEALSAELLEPNAMTLATVSPEGHPEARVVLLKGIQENGFVFYTNYDSRKGRDLAANPRAALVFLWLELHRQVRIEGPVSKTDAEESTRYFQSRPRGSQIGAWASPQSRIIGNREILEEKVNELEERYDDQEALPRPENWGGYIVHPERIEFWQGRTSRLHDRIQYRKSGEEWVMERLAP